MSKPEKPEYTRRDVQKLAPDIRHRYRDLLMANDPSGYEKLLDEYHIEGAERAELIADFTLGAELLLRRRWRSPGWH